jgi:hypothetical protein
MTILIAVLVPNKPNIDLSTYLTNPVGKLRTHCVP